MHVNIANIGFSKRIMGIQYGSSNATKINKLNLNQTIFIFKIQLE